MSNDTFTQLRDLLANVKKCDAAYKGLKAFKDNQPGLAFCAAQLLQDAAALRDHAEQLATIAYELHTMYSVVTQPEEMLGISLDGHR